MTQTQVQKLEYNFMTDIDPECRDLVLAINKMPGIFTTSSCCGHGKNPYRIFFRINDQVYLPRFLYYTDPCHVKLSKDWKVIVSTDCGMSPISFMLEGPLGEKAYEESKRIADALLKELKKK